MSEKTSVRCSDESVEAIKTIQVDRDLGQAEAVDFLIGKGMAKYTAEHKYQAGHAAKRTKRTKKG